MSIAKSKYLERGMFLLYLDQCAISRFLDGKKNEEWSEVRSLVLWGNESRRLLCPGSLEHMYETASLDDERAIAWISSCGGCLSVGHLHPNHTLSRDK